jgi:isochorismate pyruvate lyase
MSTKPLQAAAVQHCDSMTDVRAQIDRIDALIAPLLVERTGYMTQAARIKQHAHQVRDQARIDFIVARMRQMALDMGGQPEVLEAAYRALIEASIAFEHREFARLSQGETV